MKVLTSWPVPIFLLLIFAALISTSDASTAGILAAGFGLLLVLLVWGMFREFSAHAEISRALSIGDSATALRLATVELERRSARRRGPFVVYRAMAQELAGAWSDVADGLADARPETLRGTGGGASWQLVADCLRVAAWSELGELQKARELYDRAVAPRSNEQAGTGGIFAQLTEGRLRFAEGDLAAAKARLTPLTRNIRLGPAQRAIAFHTLARVAQADGEEPAAVDKLYAQAAALAPASWFAKAAPGTAASAASAASERQTAALGAEG